MTILLEIFRKAPKDCPVVLSFGMGVESVAILLLWLFFPHSRDFDLENLIVLIANPGNEFPDTISFIERRILPLLRMYGIYTVQVGRASDSLRDGIVIYDESRSPSELFAGESYQLSSELLKAGTVPQIAKGQRKCSLKFKGTVLDIWKKLRLKGPYRHAIGFNHDEQVRIERDRGYGEFNRFVFFPIDELGWSREDCKRFIWLMLGEIPPKSCCTFCPFSQGKDEVMERYDAMPELAAQAAFLEHNSMALNESMSLYGNKTLVGMLRDRGNQSALKELEKILVFSDYAIYRVRRIYWAKGRGNRKIEIIKAGGSEFELLPALKQLAESHKTVAHKTLGSWRFYSKQRIAQYPSTQEMFVLCPNIAQEKEGLKNFDAKYAKVLSEEAQPSQPIPSPSRSKRCGSGAKTLKR